MSRLYPGWGSGKTKYQSILRAYSVACRDHEELVRSKSLPATALLPAISLASRLQTRNHTRTLLPPPAA